MWLGVVRCGPKAGRIQTVKTKPAAAVASVETGAAASDPGIAGDVDNAVGRILTGRLFII